MANIRINHLDNEQDVDFILDLKPWNGKEMGRNYIDNAIRNLVNDLSHGVEGGLVYSLCGDTLIVVSLDDDDYCVTVTKVVSRGWTKRV